MPSEALMLGVAQIALLFKIALDLGEIREVAEANTTRSKKALKIARNQDGD